MSSRLHCSHWKVAHSTWRGNFSYFSCDIDNKVSLPDTFSHPLRLMHPSIRWISRSSWVTVTRNKMCYMRKWNLFSLISLSLPSIVSFAHNIHANARDKWIKLYHGPGYIFFWLCRVSSCATRFTFFISHCASCLSFFHRMRERENEAFSSAATCTCYAIIDASCGNILTITNDFNDRFARSLIISITWWIELFISCFSSLISSLEASLSWLILLYFHQTEGHGDETFNGSQ